MIPRVIQGICKNFRQRNEQNASKYHTNSKARHLSDTKVTWKGEIQPIGFSKAYNLLGTGPILLYRTD